MFDDATQSAMLSRARPITGHEGLEREWRFSSILSLTLALDGSGLTMPCVGHFPLGNNPIPLYRRLGGPQGQSEQLQKISFPLVFDPWTFLAVASHYTD